MFPLFFLCAASGRRYAVYNGTGCAGAASLMELRRGWAVL